jgi:hypothetical protein
VLPTEYPLPAPTTNLSLKSGVLFEPLHNTQPDGIAFDAPDQITMTPDGSDASEPAGPVGPVEPVEP